MELASLKEEMPKKLYEILSQEIKELRPAQIKAVHAGLLKGENLLICTPTASGKTLIAELAMMSSVFSGRGKAIYIAPLKALASEKFKEFVRRYGKDARIALSIGDLDATDSYLDKYDVILCTAEKLDSLLRHHTPWVSKVSVVVVDEIHSLNDESRGPTLEILITMLRTLVSSMQFIGLSATIGNPKELSQWLEASLVLDNWRPVKLHKGVYHEGAVEFLE